MFQIMSLIPGDNTDDIQKNRRIGPVVTDSPHPPIPSKSSAITAGLGIGFLAYVGCSLCTRQRKNLTPGVLILAAIFLMYFILA